MRALRFLVLLSLLLPCRMYAGEGAAGPIQATVLNLSLHSAVRMALAKNYNIQVQGFEPQIEQQNVTRELGVFDPVLGLGSSRDYTSRQTTFLNDLRTNERLITRLDTPIDLSLSGQTWLGTRYDLGFTSLNRGNSRDRFLDNYESGPVLSLTQPLLRGFGPSATMYRVRIARANLQISEWNLRQRVIDTITELVNVYNELYYSEQAEQVAIRSRELARQLLEDNTRRANIGVMSPLDITTARAEVAAREEGVILARRSVLDNENFLKQIVTNDIAAMLGKRVEIAPPEPSRLHVEVLEGVRDALEYRPDYRAQLLDIQQRHITISFAKNQALPQLDLTGSLGLLGYDNTFGESVGRIGERDSLNWSVGGVFSIPLGNRAARGSLGAARLEAAQSLVELKRLEQQIVVDVDNAAGQVTTGRARIASTREATRLARESLAAGEQRLSAGTGTTFEVLQLQEKQATAESAELRANADYQKALAQFMRTTGTTLREYHVEVR